MWSITVYAVEMSTATRTPATARGRATRDRIVAQAARLMYVHGVAGTSLDDVRRATSTSKSQLYHYFADKSALVCAVIAYQQQQVLNGQQVQLDAVDSWEALQAWRDHVVAMNGASVVLGGCPIGGLVNEVADSDEAARVVSRDALESWRAQLAAGLARMRDAGVLAATADPDDLALGLLAAVQGGLLLSQASQDIRPLEVALDHAIAVIQGQSQTG